MRTQASSSGPSTDLPGLSENQWAHLRDQLEQSVQRVCPRWLSDRRDDLVQVGLLRVMAVLEKSEWKRELGTSYLSRVAYSALVDEIRRLRRRQEVPLEDDEGDPLPMPSHEADPERRSIDRQLSVSLRECLAQQVRTRRIAVTLSLQGYTAPETAQLLDWTVRKVENLVFRGVADLRKCLSTKGLEP